MTIDWILTWRRRSFYVLAVICQLAALGGASPCVAVLLVYEPFLIGDGPGEYELGALHGQPDPPHGPGPFGLNTFFAGNWVDNAEQSSQVVQATSIVPWTPGGSVTAVGDGGRAGRYLAEPWDDTTVGTYYLSFAINFGESAHPSDGVGFRAVEFWPAGASIGGPYLPMYVGYNQFSPCPGLCHPEDDWANRMRLSVGRPPNIDQLLTDYPFNDDGASHHVVIKFELSDQAASDTISVYLDPVYGIPGGVDGSSAAEPPLATAVASGLDFTLGAVGAISRFGGTGILPVYDELRIGTEYADMFPPISDPSSPCSELDYSCYLEIVSHLGLSGLEVGYADIDRDGSVTIADYRIWKDNRSDLAVGAGSLSTLPVPEPTSGMLAAILTAALIGLARRSRLFFDSMVNE
jgi:hypothetical protein